MMEFYRKTQLSTIFPGKEPDLKSEEVFLRPGLLVLKLWENIVTSKMVTLLIKPQEKSTPAMFSMRW